MKSNLFLCLIALFIFACKSDPKSTPPANPISNAGNVMSIQSVKFSKSEGDCAKVCAKISVSYPEIKGGNSDFQMAVQEWVLAWVRDNAVITEENKPKRMTLEESANSFISNFQTELKERPQYIQGFEVDSQDTILCKTDKVVCLSMNTYSFQGGAHPNHQSTIANFDPNTGGPIFVNKIIKNEAAILKLITPKYIAQKSEESGEKFKIMTENGKLTFPLNWGYTEKGILFHYNTYEVGPYAIGDADVFLTWEEMGAAASKL
jgi:hypothetical protein